jgi:hypothetical protein
MGTKTHMTAAELAAWQELAKAARRLREAQRAAATRRQSGGTKPQRGNRNVK